MNAPIFEIYTERRGAGWGWQVRVLGRFAGFDSRDRVVVDAGEIHGDGGATPRRSAARAAAVAARDAWIERATVEARSGR